MTVRSVDELFHDSRFSLTTEEEVLGWVLADRLGLIAIGGSEWDRLICEGAVAPRSAAVIRRLAMNRGQLRMKLS